MSLIEEALRRIQDPLLPPEAPAAPPAQKPQKPKAPSPPPWSSQQPATARSAAPHSSVLLAVAITVLLLTICLIVSSAMWLTRTLTARHPAVAVQTSETLPTAPEQTATNQPELPMAKTFPSGRQQVIPNAPAAPTAADESRAGNLVLSGVVEGLGTPYAVINGSIVSVGDTIEGATLFEIDKGAVRLRRTDGIEVVLRVPR